MIRGFEDTDSDSAGRRALRVAARVAGRQPHLPPGRHLKPLDFKDEVGRTAGEIFRGLEPGGLDVKELKLKCSHKGMVFQAAIGWLLAEDKITASQGPEGLFIMLKR